MSTSNSNLDQIIPCSNTEELRKKKKKFRPKKLAKKLSIYSKKSGSNNLDTTQSIDECPVYLSLLLIYNGSTSLSLHSNSINH